MNRRIDVFVRTKVVVLPQLVTIGRPIGDHYCTVQQTYRYEKTVSPEEKVALSIAQKFAKANGWTVKEHDVATFGGKIEAFFRGVNKTPATFMARQRISPGVLSGSTRSN